jgi:hypothetical protein
MCSGCSGDPEDPPEGLPELDAEEASPFLALWRVPPEDVEVEMESLPRRPSSVFE